MAGILYLCATPIGNLQDMTPRGVETLRTVDLIAAEDTRNSKKLLNYFDIHTPMTSYHEYNKVEKAKYLIGLLQEGKNIALISDAGTPAISDPGEVLVRMCHENQLPVTSLPGPAACITALILSGLPTRRFCFEGFLPGDKRERREILEELYGCLGERKITLCRELTKKFETIIPMTLKEAAEYYREESPRGEYVLVLEGKSKEELRREKIASWKVMSIEEHVAYYEEQGMDHKSAMKQAAKDRGVGKREIYAYLHGSST